MTQIDLVCLANSRKHGGHCVAGWRVDGGGFVRLVSPLADGTLTPIDLRLGERDEPQMFDLIRVGIASPRPMPHQRENLVIDESPWQLLRRPASRNVLERMLPLLERGPDLLGSSGASIPYDDCIRRPAAHSIAIAKVQRAVLSVSERLQRKRLRLRFQLRKASYELTVTDPFWERAVERWEVGEYPWWKLFPSGRDPVITVSLTEPFGDGRECFKIVATLWPGPEMRGFRWPKVRPKARSAASASRSRYSGHDTLPLTAEKPWHSRFKPR